MHSGGQNFGSSPKMAAEVTRAVKKCAKARVYQAIAERDGHRGRREGLRGGGRGRPVLNQYVLACASIVRRRQPVLANIMGGLSGPRSFRSTAHGLSVTQAVRIPVIGMGGVSSARDVIEMMMAGAQPCRSARRI